MPLYLLLSVSAIEGSLLCISEDGHVAIEFVQCCNSLSAGEGLAEPGQYDACGPCTDIHYLENAGDLKSLPQTVVAFYTIQGFYQDVSSPQLDSDTDSPVLFLKPHTRNLANVQSVILLI